MIKKKKIVLQELIEKFDEKRQENTPQRVYF